jgi:hypothetical protein
MSEDIKWVTRNRKLKEDTHTQKNNVQVKKKKRQSDLRQWLTKPT